MTCSIGSSEALFAYHRLQAYPAAVVNEAGNAVEALRLLRHEDFELVFLDLRLPECDGAPELLDLGKQVRR